MLALPFLDPSLAFFALPRFGVQVEVSCPVRVSGARRSFPGFRLAPSARFALSGRFAYLSSLSVLLAFCASCFLSPWSVPFRLLVSGRFALAWRLVFC